MTDKYSRRKFLAVAGSAAAMDVMAKTVSAEQGRKTKNIKIIGVSCSPRKGKTTAAALKICLDAAGGVDKNIRKELIKLAGLNISVFDPGDVKAKHGDFTGLLPV